MSAPLRIAFLDSWRRDPSRGSGSTVAVRGLRAGLERLGHRVRTVRPRRARSGPLTGRLAYNAALPFRLSPRRYDLLVGFDFDGCFLPRRPSVPFVAALKGIAADELRFERGAARLRLGAQAGLEAWNARRARRVVVPSRYSAGWAARRYGIPPARLRVVPEGIPVDEWSAVAERGEARRPRTPPTVLSVARQYPRKNTASLLRAFPRVAASVPEARLRVIGGGPELSRLRRTAASLGIAGRVAFDGEADGETVRGAYGESHVFCLPSLQEGFGIAFLEAMAAGLPVVACRCGAVPETVPDGEAGLLCPPGNDRALARALVRLLRNAGLRRRMGRAGRRRASGYGWEGVARRFVAASGLESNGNGKG